MLTRISAIVFIFLCTSATWVGLGTEVTKRTDDYDRKLRRAVGELWGSNQKQQAPILCCNDGSGSPVSVPVEASKILVDLKLEHRQKGLLWYSTYRVKFNGRYQIANSSNDVKTMTFHFKLPSEHAVYDDFRFAQGDKEIVNPSIHNGNLTRTLTLGPGQSEFLEVGYVTGGMDEWRYDFGSTVNQAKNFSLTMTTDFNQIDFPEDGISPTKKEKAGSGWNLQWTFSNLLSSVKIGMLMPHKLNSGPWVSQVSYAAPISLFLFFFLLFVISTVREIRIHPMNYFFIGASFFSFHLLLAYLVDHFSVHVSFLISSVVSVGLLVSYMRLVVDRRFAFIEVGISQFVYLVLFSYSFFFQGYTGLAITTLCVVSLFITMQITGRLDWEAVFQKENAASQEKKIGREQPAS